MTCKTPYAENNLSQAITGCRTNARHLVVRQEKHHWSSNMYNSKLEMSYIKRFCFKHIQGPMIDMRFFLPDDDVQLQVVEPTHSNILKLGRKNISALKTCITQNLK